MKRHTFWLIIITFFFVTCAFGSAGAPKKRPPSIGVFYYPGWHEGASFSGPSDPWKNIQAFPDREPMLGWYDDRKTSVIDQQLAWMSKFGVDYIVFDWYWKGEGTFLDQSLQAYLKAHNRKSVPFAIMWANHDAEPRTNESFSLMVKYWIDHYLKRSEYLKINGKPAVFIFLGKNLDEKARVFDMGLADLLNEAQSMARDAGLPGITFFLGTGADEFAMHAASSGASGYFAYNYQVGPYGLTAGESRGSRSFTELAELYREHWDWLTEHSDLPYIVPVTAGWDRRPWGGSADPLHDQSNSDPAGFSAHLMDAAALLEKRPESTLNSIVVCCWNEYGEGSVIEPTKKWGFDYLKDIKKISPGFQSVN